MIKRFSFLFLLQKIFLIITAIIATYILPLHAFSWLGNLHGEEKYLLWLWANFDGVNYIYIAREGYSYPNFAFFPMIPILLFLIHKVLSLDLLRSGILLTNIASFVSIYVLYKITLLDYKKDIAFRTVLFFLVFPTAFYFSAVYTDAVFFLLSTISFYFARKGKWPFAGIFGFLAGITRLVGVGLFLALLVEWYLQYRERKKQKAFFWRHFWQTKGYFIVLVPLGLIAYGIYLQYFYGNFFLFRSSMVNWGQERLVTPFQVLYRYGRILFLAGKNYVYFIAVLELLAAIVYTAIGIVTARRIRLSYGVYILLLLLIPILTGTLQGMPRYGMHAFPTMIACAIMTKKSKKLFIAIIIGSILLQVILFSFFARGYFVS